jgi:hypothetical protein
MDRLNDFKIMGRSSKCEHYAGNIRRIINQHMAETISIFTLGDMLKVKAGSFCTYKKGKDDKNTIG